MKYESSYFINYVHFAIEVLCGGAERPGGGLTYDRPKICLQKIRSKVLSIHIILQPP